ncbi:hypothetical protein BJ742DRAFT_482261 [Cladochytrium replicatum]|nr:hypothetical protein BJ742DRAFT_482261 [Cladochytrium replicatum]
MLTPPPVMRTALGGFAREIFVPPFKGPPDADESIHSFISRRFNTALSENIVSAVIHGIYAGDVKKLSVRSTMMRGMWDMERKHGGLVRGTIASIFNSPPNEEDLFVRDMQKDTSVYSFPEGLQELSDALERSLVKSGRVEFVNDEVECMDFKGWKGVEIRSTKGRIEADAVISALPANQLSRVLSASNTYTPSLAFEPKQVASLLSKIKFISVAVVNFAFTLPSNQSDLPKALQDGGGFGYLVPSSANSPVLGVVFDSSAVPAQDGGAKILRLTAMLGGHRFEEFFGDPDKADQEEILGIALETGIKRFLGLDLSKAILIASRVVVNKECIPQYYVGHNTLLEEIHESLLGGQLAVVGSSYLGVGINDVILNARKVASGIAQGDNSLTGLGDVQ